MNLTYRSLIPFCSVLLVLALSAVGCDLQEHYRATYFQTTIGFQLDDFALSIREGDGGGFVIAGRTSSPRDNTDAYVVVTDARFNVLWSKTIGGSGVDQGYAATQLPDGSILFAGSIDTRENDQEAFLARIDDRSNILWMKTLGGPSNDEIRDIQVVGETIYACGTYQYAGINSDVWLLAFSLDGDSLWTRKFDIRSTDRGRSLAICREGGFVLSAQTEGLDSVKFVHCLIRVDAAGNKIWHQTHSGINRDEPAQVIQTSDGGFALVGTTNFKPIFRPPQLAATLVRVSPTGEVLWYREYRHTANDEAYALVELDDNGFLFAGTSLTDTYGSNNQLSLIRTDANGDTVWVRYHGGSDTEVAHALIRYGAGYAVAGYTQSYGEGKSDIYCLRMDADGQIER